MYIVNIVDLYGVRIFSVSGKMDSGDEGVDGEISPENVCSRAGPACWQFCADAVLAAVVVSESVV